MPQIFIKLSNTSRGIIWMLAHCIVLTLVMCVMRGLSGQVNSYNIIFWQSLVALIGIVAYRAKNRITIPHKTKKLHLYILRVLGGTASGLLLVYSLSKINLNTATAITFTSPLFTTIFAIILLGERTNTHRAIGLIIGFIGALIILRPGTDVFDINSLYFVLVAALWGISDNLIKLLNRSENIHTMMFLRAILMVAINAPLAALHSQHITLEQFGWLALLGLLDLANFGTAIKAYSYADISVLMPFDFSRLVFSAIIAYAVFNERLDLLTAIGSAVIICGTMFVIWHEKRRAKVPKFDEI